MTKNIPKQVGRAPIEISIERTRPTKLGLCVHNIIQHPHQPVHARRTKKYHHHHRGIIFAPNDSKKNQVRTNCHPPFAWFVLLEEWPVAGGEWRSIMPTGAIGASVGAPKKTFETTTEHLFSPHDQNLVAHKTHDLWCSYRY